MTSSQSAAWRSARSTRSAMTRALAHAGDAQAVGHVLEDRLRERVRPLEHHAHAPAHEDRIDVWAVDGLAVELHVPVDRDARDGVVHPVERPQERALAAAAGADEREDAACAWTSMITSWMATFSPYRTVSPLARIFSWGTLPWRTLRLRRPRPGVWGYRARVPCRLCDVRVTSRLGSAMGPDGHSPASGRRSGAACGSLGPCGTITRAPTQR